MIKNILLTTFRNFRKNQIFVLINVLGLGLTLACCIVAFYNYKFEADFDSNHQKKDEIYKVELTQLTSDKQQAYSMSPVSLKPQIEGTLSGVENVVRYHENRQSIKYENTILNHFIAYADENFFDLFDFSMKSGDINSFKDKGNTIITEKFAETYFGDEDPIGKIVTVYNDQGIGKNYIVSGIFNELPRNNTFYFQIFVLYENYIDVTGTDEMDWQSWTAGTFLHIPDKSKVKDVEKLLEQYVPIQNDAHESFQVSSFYLISLDAASKSGRDIWSYWLNRGMHPAQVIAPSIMALLVLLLAAFNYTNTSIAISSKRLKEIGLRKVVGGVRKQIIFQFLFENILLCFLALIVSIALGNILLSGYSALWPGMNFSINFKEDLDFWMFLIGLLFFTALIAGAYPAFYISKFHPIPILKGASKFAGTNLFTKILLVFQFAIAITGIICSVIFTQNAKFQDELYLGYNTDQLLAIPIDTSRLETFKNQIKQNPLITKIGETEEQIGRGRYSRKLEYDNKQTEVFGYDIGDDYFNTMGLTLLEGREFEEKYANIDIEKSVIVNEKLVKQLDIKDPVGKRIKLADTVDLTIIGVVQDFYPFGVWVKIEPVILRRGIDHQMRNLAVQTNIENINKVDNYLRTEWESMFPNNTYEGYVQSERLNEAKDVNRSIIKIFIFLAIISLLISLTGLYTLISLIIIKKTQEIGIRKVLGSTIQKLVLLLNKDFFIIIFFAGILGSAMGYFLAEMLLGSIWEVFIQINFISIILPVLLIFIISTITISGKVYFAAAGTQ
jgi:putative ABC transport system permease protein